MDAFPFVLNQLWRFIDSIKIPGLGFSFGSLMIGTVVIGMSLSLLRIGFGLTSSAVGSAHRAGRRAKAKISKNREDDEV